MGARIRAFDWRATSLGAPDTWPGALCTALGIILESGQPMYVWWGPELLCFYNDAFRALIGAERHPASLGRPVREVWREIWPVIGPQIARVLAGGGGTLRENELVPITRNGRLEDIYWTYTYSPIRLAGAPQGVGGIFVVCTDTTVQVLAARRDAAERERLALLFEQTPAMIAVLRGPQHLIEIANPLIAEFFGGRPLTGRTVAVALPEPEFQAYLPLLDEVLRGGQPQVIRGARFWVNPHSGKPAEERWGDFVYNPLRDAAGVVTGIFVYGIDVTARTRAEAELRELNDTLERRVAEALAARKVFADVVDATDAFVQVIDRNYTILAINRACAGEYSRLRGVRPKPGDSLLAVVEKFPEQRAAFEAIWSRALAGEEFSVTLELDDAPGERRWYEMKFNALRDRDGELLGAFQFAHEVSDRLRDQARLIEAERQLRQRQKIDAIGQLTGGLAHDFNNLLMVISGGLSLLERPSEAPRRQRVITQMRQAAERGASLSRQLLAFARRQPLHPQPLDVPQHIGGMRELLDRTLRGDVEVRTALAEDLWPITADPAELELVILNLCVNARDAMPAGGVITLHAVNVPGYRDGALAGDFVALRVSDTGTGMSAAVLAHMFEPFFTTKEIGKGSGLGLAQVYGFVQQSGGAVKVDSTEGKGTSVTLYLPRSPTNPMQANDVPAETGTGRWRTPAASILLVEDDNEVAALVTDLLRELGYRVTRAAGAQAALGALSDDPTINLIFTDVMMPGPMNGVDLARELRKRRPDLPVLLTTGYAGAVLQTAAAEDMEVLCKPYEIKALEAALRSAFAARRR